MADDLVERLRQRSLARLSLKRPTKVDHADAALDVEAAARIQALEAALAEAEGRVIARVQAELESLLDDVEKAGNPFSEDSHEGQKIGIAQAMARVENVFTRALASDPLLDRQGKEGV